VQVSARGCARQEPILISTVPSIPTTTTTTSSSSSSFRSAYYSSCNCVAREGGGGVEGEGVLILHQKSQCPSVSPIFMYTRALRYENLTPRSWSWFCTPGACCLRGDRDMCSLNRLCSLNRCAPGACCLRGDRARSKGAVTPSAIKTCLDSAGMCVCECVCVCVCV
jgi:hypothetical protein